MERKLVFRSNLSIVRLVDRLFILPVTTELSIVQNSAPQTERDGTETKP